MNSSLIVLVGFLGCTVARIFGAVLPNDDFADRIHLGTGLPKATAATDLGNASNETLEPDWLGIGYWGGGTSRSAWWSWTADANGWVEVEMTGAEVNAGVYEGDTLDTLRERQITGPLWKGRHSLFRAEAGHTYHLRLIGDGVTTGALIPVVDEARIFAGYDLSGPLPVESSRWGHEGILAEELPEGAWGPGSYAINDNHGSWNWPHDGYYLVEVIWDQYAAGGSEVSATLIDSGTRDDSKSEWMAVRGEAGQSCSVTTRADRRYRNLATVRVSEIPIIPLESAEVTGTLPLTVVRPLGALANGGTAAVPSLWDNILWVATETGPCSVRCDPGQTVYEVRVEVSPGDWQRIMEQQLDQGMETLYFKAVAGVRYRIRGSTRHPEEPWRAVIDWSSAAPNDERESATDLGTAEDVIVAGTTRLATAIQEDRTLFESNDVRCTVWGRWKAPSSGQKQMRMKQLKFQPPAMRAFSLVDDRLIRIDLVNVADTENEFTFDARAGGIYYFGFATFGGCFDWTWGVLNVPVPPGPGEPPEIVLRPVESKREAEDFVTLPPAFPGHRRVIQWEWRPPASGSYMLNYPSHPLTIHRRDASGAETAVPVQPFSPLTQYVFSAVAGESYVFRHENGNSGQFSFRVRPFAPIPHPTPGHAGDLGNLLPAHGKALLRKDGEASWWKWTAPVTGPVTLPLVGNGVTVYDENLMPHGAPVVATSDGDKMMQYVNVYEGRQYYFVLSPNSIGVAEINLRRTEVTRPANDDFASAEDLGEERMVKWNGTGHGAVTMWNMAHGSANIERDCLTLSSLEPGEPVHAPTAKLRHVHGSLWWRWTAPRTERIRLYGFGPAAVYSGSSLESLSAVEMGTNTEDGAVVLNAAGGTTYHIASLRDAGLSPKMNVWVLADTPGVVNDAFADRLPVFPTETEDVFAFNSEWHPAGAATLEAGEPMPPNSDPPSVSAWWRWRCTVTGFYKFTNGFYGEPKAGRIFKGESLSTLVENPQTGLGYYAAIAGRDYVIARYHLPDEGSEDLTLLWRVTDRPYEAWTGQFIFQDERDLLAASNPPGDGVSNELKFFCGLDPTRNAYGTDEPNAINLPQVVRTASGGRAIRYRFHWPNVQIVPSSYWTPHAYLRKSADLENWVEVWPLPDTATDPEGFAEISLPDSTGGGRLFHRLEFGLTYDP